MPEIVEGKTVRTIIWPLDTEKTEPVAFNIPAAYNHHLTTAKEFYDTSLTWFNGVVAQFENVHLLAQPVDVQATVAASLANGIQKYSDQLTRERETSADDTRHYYVASLFNELHLVPAYIDTILCLPESFSTFMILNEAVAFVDHIYPVSSLNNVEEGTAVILNGTVNASHHPAQDSTGNAPYFILARDGGEVACTYDKGTHLRGKTSCLRRMRRAPYLKSDYVTKQHLYDRVNAAETAHEHIRVLGSVRNGRVVVDLFKFDDAIYGFFIEPISELNDRKP